MPTLSIHLPVALHKKVKATARRLKQKPSQFALIPLEHELAKTPPAVTLGFMKGTFSIAPDYNPAATVIPPKDCES